MKRREEKAFKQSGNRSRADSGNPGESGGGVSTNPDALTTPAATSEVASAAAAAEVPPVRIRERRSNKSTNYDSALKSPFPRMTLSSFQNERLNWVNDPSIHQT